MLILFPCSLAVCTDRTCRSPSCCAERDCSSNLPDPDDQSYITCSCMIPLASSSCLSLGTTVVLSCDPGGICQDHCSWTTPVGTCEKSSTTQQCQDSSLRILNQEGTCNVEITGVQTRHQGIWRCQTTPYIHTFTDSVNLTVANDCSTIGGGKWYAAGWSASLFWSGMVLILIILIVIVCLLIFCFCPGICLCFPCCARQHRKMEEEDPKSRQTKDISFKKSSRELRHSPVTVIDNRHEHKYPRREPVSEPITHDISFPYRQQNGREDDDYENLVEDLPPPPINLDYEVPTHYSEGSNNVRKAKKKSNLVSKELEERIRKASGVGRQDHI